MRLAKVKRLIPPTLALAALGLPSAAVAEWTKTYVIEWHEPAMYYGAKSGVIDPGTDCPNGSNPEIDWIKVLVDAGYTEEEAKWLRNPANPTRSPVHGQNQMAFRGKNRANVYVNPTSTPDPGLVGVAGNIGEGINLDGDETTGFTSPSGEKGIDNNFYKTLGCWKTYRGPQRLSSGALQFNDSMRNGGWTTVIVVAGKGNDPMNDDDVTVGFYLSDDKMVKDGNGNIARDYTFAIKPHPKYEAIFPARTKNGFITSTKPVDGVMLRNPGYDRNLDLERAQVKLEMKEDGSLTGYVGGYRAWEPVYQGWVNARGPVIEALTWVQLPGVYYALQRNADFSPEGRKTKTHISYALRVDALPAYVMTPDANQQVASVRSYKSLAEPETARMAALPFYIVDGLVIDPKAKTQAGPDAVILPQGGVTAAKK